MEKLSTHSIDNPLVIKEIEMIFMDEIGVQLNSVNILQMCIPMHSFNASQGKKLQNSFSMSCPLHTPPSFSSTIFIRIFLRFPFPHVVEHGEIVHSLH
jgi:hypothetical protein